MDAIPSEDYLRVVIAGSFCVFFVAPHRQTPWVCLHQVFGGYDELLALLFRQDVVDDSDVTRFDLIKQKKY